MLCDSFMSISRIPSLTTSHRSDRSGIAWRDGYAVGWLASTWQNPGWFKKPLEITARVDKATFSRGAADKTPGD
jgi:hypothetical protein